jgi:hypothetical protein
MAISLVPLYVGAAPAATAEFRIPTVTAATGENVGISVEYRAQEAEVSAVLFDLEYDPSVLAITPTIGDAAAAADKVMYFNVLPGPGGTAHLRILIFGLNQTVIEDGSMVDLSILVSPTASRGAHSLDLVDLSLASPDAEAVPANVHSGRVIITGSN